MVGLRVSSCRQHAEAAIYVGGYQSEPACFLFGLHELAGEAALWCIRYVPQLPTGTGALEDGSSSPRLTAPGQKVFADEVPRTKV